MSSEVHIDTPGESGDAFDAPERVYEALAHPHRSATIVVLRERRRPIPTSDLATWVAARTNDKPLVEVERSEHQHVLTSLRHNHLPTLRERDLIDWCPDADEVALADEPTVDRDRLTALVDVRADAGGDRLFRTLANSRRRRVITVLADVEETSVETLARRVAAREARTDPDDVSEQTVDRVEVSLHHSHLPAMAGIDLLAYDRESDSVSYEGHPLLIAR